MSNSYLNKSETELSIKRKKISKDITERILEAKIVFLPETTVNAYIFYILNETNVLFLLGYCAMSTIINKNHNVIIKDYFSSYMKNKSPDCVLYSEDGTEFKIHKEIFCQTKFMREMLKSSNCCSKIEIICPCSTEELEQLIEFLLHGKIRCENESAASKVFQNLSKILDFPSYLDYPGKFIFDNQNKAPVNDDSSSTKTNKECETSTYDDFFPKNTNNESESVEIISDDTIFVAPMDIKKETSEKEFQSGLAVLEEMGEPILKKEPKEEPLDNETELNHEHSSVDSLETGINTVEISGNIFKVFSAKNDNINLQRSVNVNLPNINEISEG